MDNYNIPKPYCLIVLGMHRSGTSALTGVLSLLGIHPGDKLMPAAEGNNPKGFWEHAEIVSIHEQLLNALDSSWDDVNALPDRWWLSSHVTEFRNRILDVLRRDFSHLPIWLIKDPRMCRLLPLWQEVLREISCQPLYILALRNPSEVAHSLHKRNELAEETSCLLWLSHMLEAEYQTRNQSRIFVNYEHLLSDWQSTVTDISKALSITWPIPVNDASPHIEAFLDSSLRHHTDNTALSSHPACHLALEGFNALSEPELNPEQLDLLRAKTDKLIGIIGHISKQLRRCNKQYLDLRTYVFRLESEKDALHSEIFRIKNTVSWQVTKPIRFVWNRLLQPAWHFSSNLNYLLRPASNSLLRLAGRQTLGRMHAQHPRAIMARLHLRGQGIEIGAKHFPVLRHSNMKVRYIDNISREACIEKFPELRTFELVNPDDIEDGFTLASFPDTSEDFLIANHLLELTPNPLGALTNWARILKPDGTMLISVPIAEACIDRGRQITSLGHMLEDYHSDPHKLRRRNLDHYLEWVSISEPALLSTNHRPNNKESLAERMARAEKMCRDNSEINFHTFTADSFRKLLEYFATSLDGRFKVVEVRDEGTEVIAVISRE